MTDPANSAQIRMIAETIAEATILKHEQSNPKPAKTEIPAPLKWAGTIAAALMTTGVVGFFAWQVQTLSTVQGTVNDMKITIARMDERAASQGIQKDSRFEDFDRRISRLEAVHQLKR